MELTNEEKEMKITLAQKEKMERDHDRIKDYFKVGLRIEYYCQGLLKEWADDLASRSIEEKKSPEGKEATKSCQQAADTLKGFFKLCSKRVFLQLIEC